MSPVVGVDDPNEGEHYCRVPLGLFHKKWTVWRCPRCGRLWRKEPPRYGDMDSWTYHPYNQEEAGA